MKVLKQYFKRRKEASRLHHILYDIQQIQVNCYDGLFKGINNDKYNRLINAIRDVIKKLENSWDEISFEEREKLSNGGLFDEEIQYDPFEWLRRFERLVRKELKGKVFMFCWQGVCITLWEIPLWIGGMYLILSFIS